MTRSFIFLAGVAAMICGCASPSLHDHPPTIAGQPVPNENIILDFTKHYDVVCQDGQSTRIYRDCRVLGYTGETVRNASGTLSKEYYGQFRRWLVIELPDGRRAFLPSGSVTFLEESKK